MLIRRGGRWCDAILPADNIIRCGYVSFVRFVVVRRCHIHSRGLSSVACAVAGAAALSSRHNDRKTLTEKLNNWIVRTLVTESSMPVHKSRWGRIWLVWKTRPGQGGIGGRGGWLEVVGCLFGLGYISAGHRWWMRWGRGQEGIMCKEIRHEDESRWAKNKH